MKCSYRSNHVLNWQSLIEQGHLDDHFVRDVCTEYLEPLLSREIEVVVLGCTHFPFVQPLLEELTSGRIQFIDPAFETSEFVRRRLEGKICLTLKNGGYRVIVFYKGY